jgi:hypothetical protein
MMNIRFMLRRPPFQVVPGLLPFRYWWKNSVRSAHSCAYSVPTEFHGVGPNLVDYEVVKKPMRLLIASKVALTMESFSF